MTATQKKWGGSILATQEKPIISVKEARKVLGHDAVDLSDASVLGVINSLQKIASNLLDSSRVPNNIMVQ